MAELQYTDFKNNIRIIQQTERPKSIEFEKIDQLLIILPKKKPTGVLFFFKSISKQNWQANGVKIFFVTIK